MNDEVNTEEAAAAAAEKAAAEKAAKAAEREAAKAAKEAEKAAKAAEREAIKAAKAAEREAAKAANQRPEQNGIRMPKEGGLCWQAWQLISEISAEKKAPAVLADVIPVAEARGLNPGNVRAEYGQWCKFYGVPRTGRRAAKTEEAPAEAVAE